MFLGFLTVCLGDMPLGEKAKWASDNGFKGIEIACWPKLSGRDYSSSDIDVDTLTTKEADRIKAYMKEYGLTISSLAYYDNNLDKDLEKRRFINNHVKKVIDAAVMLETPLVGTFTGRNTDKSTKENFDEFEKVFGELVNYAEKKDIKLMIENCDMRGWQIPGQPGTISYTPELWEEMFRRIPSRNFGLNYDPSHLILMLMDYISPVHAFKDRIFHVHAKDGNIIKSGLDRYGVFDKQLGELGEWGYRQAKMPGLGSIDWGKFINALREIGYDYVVSIEHEDKDYEGSLELVKEGLIIGKKHLEKLVRKV